MHDTLLIRNVDLRMLKQQRKALQKLVLDPIFNEMTTEQQNCLEGLLNMLCSWKHSGRNTK